MHKDHSGHKYILIGTALIFIAVFLLKHNLDEASEAGTASDEMLEGVIEQMPGTVLENLSGDMPVVDVDGHSFVGTLEIPSLELLLPVQSSWSQEDAKYAVCRYEGSMYDDDLIIAGHNYTEHFGNLSELTSGDVVIVTDMNGMSKYYEVTNMETLGAYDVEKMEAGDWDLTLFTCTLGGANRVTIRCEFVGKYSETGTTPDVLDAAEKSKHIRK